MALIQPHQRRWIEKNLIDYDIRFVVIGGVAVKFYHPARDTDDVDLFIGADPSTITRLVAAIPQLSADPNARARLLDSRVGHFKVEGPHKIDVLTFAPGLEINEAYNTAEILYDGNIRMPVVRKSLLISHKKLVNEPKDLEDVSKLL